MLKDEIEKLVELQEIDKELRRWEEEVSLFPEKRKEYQSRLENKKSELSCFNKVFIFILFSIKSKIFII